MRPSLRVALAFTALFASACGQKIAVQNYRDREDSTKKHAQAFAAAKKLGDEAGSAGEKAAMSYVKTYFDRLGLETVVRSVPLVNMTPLSTVMQVSSASGLMLARPENGVDYLLGAGHQIEQIDVHAGVVFVGYGILSPEYTRDDYKGLDVRGKVVLVLEGTPRTGNQDTLGKLGEAYYGRRFYKFAEGRRHGAAAVLIIHGAYQPWDLMAKQSVGVEINIASEPGNAAAKSDVEGWVSQPYARRLMKAAGLDYDQLVMEARELAFQPSVLQNTVIDINLTYKVDRVSTSQIIAVLRGQTQEYVMLSSQWNGLPLVLREPDTPRAVDGADILAGLSGDGSGSAVVMETARRIVATRQKPLRSLVFTISTCLKPGVMGLEHYADHPPFPLSKTIAQIFIDQAWPTAANQGVGKIGTSADDALSQMMRDEAMAQKRNLVADQNVERRFYYKYSQTAFASHGVPTLYITTPPQLDLPKLMGAPKINTDSHPLNDADLDLDAILLTKITTRVANVTNWRSRTFPLTPVR